MFQTRLSRRCALVAVLAFLGGLVSTRSAIAQEPTVLVLIEAAYYPEANEAWFADEVVGIRLDGNDPVGNANAISCSVPDFEGSYALTDAVLVTKRGERVFCQVYVKDVSLPAHGFLSATHFQDVAFFFLDNSTNNLQVGGEFSPWRGFFVSL